MAQKANPYAIRLGYNQVWNNYFFAENRKEQNNYLTKDKLIRDYLKKLFPDIDRLKIEYSKTNIFIYLYIPEVSLVLGEDNSKLEKVMKGIYDIVNDAKIKVKVSLIEVKKIYANAQSIANLISGQLKKRMRSRQIIKNILSKITLEREVKGAKIEISGRLDESDMAQTRKVVQGKMPLSTIDSNIEIGRAETVTSYGKIGIKVLIYKGKIWQKKNKNYVNTEKN
ncbi:MAG: 30S ribosomal protein S3 [Mycoplasmataceae bacterium]|nr:MAG: 30S ribosomal protein S3 [Mycoplasmataceae bacterium]